MSRERAGGKIYIGNSKRGRERWFLFREIFKITEKFSKMKFDCEINADKVTAFCKFLMTSNYHATQQ